LAAAAVLLGASSAGASWRASADSLFSEGDSAFERGAYEAAAELFGLAITTVDSSGVESPVAYFTQLAARARFLRARSLERLERWDEALGEYVVSLDELPEIEDYVRFRMAACHEESDNIESAKSELRLVIDDGADTAFDPPAVLELASLYEDEGSYDMALQWYRLYLAEAEGYNDRALAHYRIGRTYEKRGDDESAKRSYAEAVDDYPRSRHAHDALARARKLSRSFTDRYHQGLVLYNRSLYSDAVEFFTYYVRHDKEKEFEHEANYFLARSHQRLGEYRTAAKRFEDATEFGPDAEYYDLAASKLAYCRRAIGKLEESLATYERFAVAHPERDAAAELLWEKARLLEEKGRWDEAGAEFRRIAGVHSESSRAEDAAFRAGLCLYKQEDHERAAAVFAEAAEGASGEAAARCLFWSAKCHEHLSGDGEAVVVYREAMDTAPDSYYAARAGARLRELGQIDSAAPANGRRPRGVRPMLWGHEALEFAAWLAEWYDEVYFPAERVALRQRIYGHASFRRADTLLALHIRDAALAELTLLADDIGRDPRALDILVDYCERVGLHKRAILLAERILAISPADGLSETPTYLRKRICPTHFRGIVERECAARSIDKNIEFSLIRQESLFEPTAVSWVGARGLSQIMPATGRWVARRLGHKNFRTSQLFDPALNVRFGTEYLSVQLAEFDGDVVRALAAYNGGPEASERWWGYGGERDSDVFVEDIGYSQTFDYVRRVVLYSEVYRELYGE
jgi:soluble lytic murein transglycosylase